MISAQELHRTSWELHWGTNRHNESPPPNVRLIEQRNQGPGLVDHHLRTRMQPGIDKHDHRPGAEVEKRETELYELFDAENEYARTGTHSNHIIEYRIATP